MWKTLQIMTAVCVIALLAKPDHFKAIRHEFYQVWDTISEMKDEVLP